MADTLRLALVQQSTVWHDKDANLAAAAKHVAAAAAQGARLVAFTELFATGFTMSAREHAEPIPGPTVHALSDLARKHGVFIVGTAIEAHEPKPRNAAFLLGPDGTLRGVYRKIHPFSFGDESNHYVGGEDAPVFDVDGVKVGLQVCYDLRFPETFRSLLSRGAELVIVPANWPSRRARHWSVLLEARAIENQCVVAGINRCGRDPGLEYPGLSAIHGPRGETLALAGDTEQLVVADVDLADVRAWRAQFPALRDRRTDVYDRLG